MTYFAYHHDAYERLLSTARARSLEVRGQDWEGLEDLFGHLAQRWYTEQTPLALIEQLDDGAPRRSETLRVSGYSYPTNAQGESELHMVLKGEGTQRSIYLQRDNRPHLALLDDGIYISESIDPERPYSGRMERMLIAESALEEKLTP